jgi:hypothetical protein
VGALLRTLRPGWTSSHAEGSQENKETEGEVNMRWGDPLIGRMELYYVVGVAVLMAVAYLIRAVVG